MYKKKNQLPLDNIWIEILTLMPITACGSAILVCNEADERPSLKDYILLYFFSIATSPGAVYWWYQTSLSKAKVL